MIVCGPLPKCVDPTTDESNCGGCGVRCYFTCIDGACQQTPAECDGNLTPLNRWCDQGNGTVKDMTTGLVWLKDAGWGGLKPWREEGDWTYNDDAHTRAGILYAGMSGAGLSDGSVEGDWRLPTKSALVGITVGDEYIRSSQMYFFTNVQSFIYWSSTTLAGSTYYAWLVYMGYGDVYDASKDYYSYVWPVRGGQ